MSILKTNLSCFKQKNLYRFDFPYYNIFNQSENERKIISQAIKESNSKFDKYSMPDRIRASLFDYTQNNSYGLNYFMNNQTLRSDEEFDEIFYNVFGNDFSKALSYLPNIKGTFYRQVGFGNLNDKNFSGSYEDFMNFVGKHKKGQFIEYPSFISTSTHESVYYFNEAKYRGLFMIHGRNGKSIEDFSRHRNEHEIVFKPNTKFYVADTDWVDNNTFASILVEEGYF